MCSTVFTDLVHVVGQSYLGGRTHFRGPWPPLEENIVRDMTVLYCMVVPYYGIVHDIEVQ